MVNPPADAYIPRAKKAGGIDMENINRLVILSATVAAVGLVAGAGPVNAQTREARGTVTAVTDSTMSVKAGAWELTFYIDGQTSLEVRRSARDVQAAQPGNPKPRVNDFFQAGNTVRVRYRAENGRNHALNIERVGSAGGGGSIKPPIGVAEGKVTSVSASHMTIAADSGAFTFAITGDTDVLARGASTATKAAGKGTPLTTFVNSGDKVSVRYRQAAGAMAASEIRVQAVSRD
jgi:Domain of unknown function (DUF5666)